MNYELRRNLTICLTITLLSGIFLLGCGKKKERLSEVPGLPGAEKPILETAQPLSKKTTSSYEYKAAGLRSPFAPLTSEGKVISPEEGAGAVAVDINSLQLKGIIYDEKSRNALLVTSSGESYIVKEGKLLASNGKYVEGVSGIVKKGSVVLITKGNIIREIKLREEEY